MPDAGKHAELTRKLAEQTRKEPVVEPKKEGVEPKTTEGRPSNAWFSDGIDPSKLKLGKERL